MAESEQRVLIIMRVYCFSVSFSSFFEVLYLKMKNRQLLALGLALASILIFGADTQARRVSVKGYFRKNGTYVRPHYRTSPDGYCFNNLSGCPGSGLGNTRNSPELPYIKFPVIQPEGYKSSPPETKLPVMIHTLQIREIYNFGNRNYKHLDCSYTETAYSPMVVFHVYISESAYAKGLPSNVSCYGYEIIVRNQKSFRKISTLKNESEAEYLAKLLGGWYAKETLK